MKAKNLSLYDKCIMAKTYALTTKNTWLQPYWNALLDGSKPEIEYSNKDSYKKLSEETLKLVLKDVIDPPDHEMTIAEVKKEFAYSNEVMSDKVAQRIVSYHNGRKAIYERLLDLIGDDFEYEKMVIPEECNGFTTQENDEEFTKNRQLEAWIEIRAE